MAVTAPDPVTNFVVNKRGTVGFVLLAIGLAFLALAVYGGAQGFSSPNKNREKEALQDKKPELSAKEEAEALKAAEHRAAYVVCAVVCLFGGMFGIGIGGWTLAKEPPLGREATEARTVILGAGMGFGLIVFLLGAVLGILWFGKVNAWLDDGDRNAAAYVLVAAGLLLLGAAIAFLSTAPARADVQNDVTIRRLVYGANTILSTLLAFSLLLGLNIAVSLRAPGKLDTTEAGFYSLSDETKEYLETSTQTVMVYALLPDEERMKEPGRRIVADTRRLLAACEAMGKGRFKIQNVSDVFDKDLMNTLKEKFKLAGGTENGLLITVANDETKFSFLRLGDLVTVTSTETGPAKPVFQGEAKLMSELIFLSDNKQKAIVYVTQFSGELLFIPRADREPNPDRTANRMRELLLKLNLEVKLLEISKDKPVVPVDAAMVLVADPRAPLPKETVQAITAYMEDTKKPGKLILFSGANAKPVGDGVQETGLEDLVKKYGITLGDKFVFSAMMSKKDELAVGRAVLAAASATLSRARNPVALAVLERGVFLTNPRTIDIAVAANATDGPKAEALLYSTDAQATWLESSPTVNPSKAFQDMEKDAKLMQAKDFSDKPRSMAAIVKDGDKPRAVVFGTGMFFSDKNQGEAGATPDELLGRTVTWLREKPAVAGIASKNYNEYSINPTASYARLFWVPVLLGLLFVVTLGAGVWVVRRK